MLLGHAGASLAAQATPPLPRSPALHALMCAAVALPGLAASLPCVADEDEANFQYGRFTEGSRSLVGPGGEEVRSKYRPIVAESLFGSARLSLNDRLKMQLNLTQDTWSGATPIATAPAVAFGNRPTAPDGISGASPYLYSNMVLDGKFRPLYITNNGYGEVSHGPNTRLVHTMSSASPETRRQADVLFTRTRNDGAFNIGGGISSEPDFESTFVNLGGSIDLDQKLSSLSAGLSVTHSKINARFDHDAFPYIYGIYDLKGNNLYNRDNSSSRIVDGRYSPVLSGTRNDWSAYLGATQVLNKNAQMEASLGYTRSAGYLSNPYKMVEVAFIDPAQQWGTAGGNKDALYAYDAQVAALPERRPDLRNQGNLDLRLAQYVAATDAALHLNYRYFQDDWGIRAHTLGAQWAQPLGNGWTVTPRVRYYSQDAASFYTPYLVTQQGYFSYVTDPVNGPIYVNGNTPNDGHRYYEDPTFTVKPPIDPKTGNPVVGWATGAAVIDKGTGKPVNDQSVVDSLMQDTVMFDPKKLPSYYSSDHRLAAFGTLSGGLAISKQFARGVTFEISAEYFARASKLHIGGSDGDGGYADFNYYTVNAALIVDLNMVGNRLAGSGADDDADHALHAGHGVHAGTAPAGVLFDHMLPNPGDWMIGYRYLGTRQSGDMVAGRERVNDAWIVGSGCMPGPCYVRPTSMTMSMNMLEIMAAPTSWLNLMLMPQYVTMNMSMQPLEGAPPPDDSMGPVGSAIMHSGHPHATGSIGDTGLYALFDLHDDEEQQVNLALGVSIPTGSVNLRQRSVMQQPMGLVHYGMQTGSGTWDFKPALTWTGQQGAWNWGAQLSGTVRLDHHNASGYALGDEAQATAWAGVAWRSGLSATLRALYTRQGAIRGEYDRDVPVAIGPMDNPANYGGRFWDVGVGINYAVTTGALAGNQLKFEWLQPAASDFNGVQLERKGSLAFSWSIAF